MTETDSYYYTLKIRDELIAQNKKLDKVIEKLETQTRLQEGIFKQLYLLCQIAATPSDMMKTSLSRDSISVFTNTIHQNNDNKEQP